MIAKNQVPPKWCPNAVATARGWENPTTKELYVSNKFLTVEPATEPVVEVESIVEVEPVVVTKKTTRKK